MLKKASHAEAVTHYTFTNDTKVDWNDKFKELGKEGFAKYFIKSLKRG